MNESTEIRVEQVVACKELFDAVRLLGVSARVFGKNIRATVETAELEKTLEVWKNAQEVWDW